MQYTPDFQHADVHDIEDQVASEHDAADASAQARPQRRGSGKLGDLPAACAQLGDERDRASRVVAGNEVADFLDVTLRLAAVGIASCPAALRDTAVLCFEPVERRLAWLIGEAAGTALLDQVTQFELALPVAILQHTERVAHDLTGVVVSPAGHLTVDEFLEVGAEGKAAGHTSGVPVGNQEIIVIIPAPASLVVGP